MSDLSRVEQLLRNALGEDIYEVTPQSRVEILLAQLNELIEGISASVDPEELTPIVTAWLAENIHDGAVVDASLSVAGAAAESKKTGEEISQLKEDLTEILPLSNLTIEGYDKTEWKDVLIEASLTERKYVEMKQGVAVVSNSSGYKFYQLSVTEGETYKVTGNNAFDMRPMIYTDDNDNVLFYLPEQRVTTNTEVTVEGTAPVGATKLYINAETNKSAKAYKKGVYYVADASANNDITVTIAKSRDLDVTITAIVGNAKIIQEARVFNGDDNNNAVLPRSCYLEKDGVTRTIINNEDDNCPVELSSGYIGAGHGYTRCYKITKTAHGKTYADIGSQWASNAQYPRDYWIVRILDENSFVIVCEDVRDSSNHYDLEAWTGGDTLTHVSGGTHTDAITGFTRTSYLLTPMDKNHVKKVLLDGVIEVSDNGEYTAQKFVDVVDEYDIINPQTIVPQILANMPSGGYTENPVFNTGDTFLHFSNVYRYLSDGTLCLYSTLDNDLPINVKYWATTQYAQKSPLDAFGGGLFRYVPKLLPVSGRDLRIPFNMSSWNFTIDATSEYWEDANNPPDRLLHLFTDANNNYVAGYAVGYLPVAYGVPSVRKNNISNAMMLYNTMKFYPHLVDGNGSTAVTIPEYTAIQSVVYRKPLINVGNVHTSAYFVPYGDKCYMYVDYHTLADDRIKVPADYIGKPITVLEKSDNVTVYGSIATDEIRIRVATSDPMYGYAVAQIG